MIRYLKKEEYGKCRPLWEASFSDETRAFTDYYFSEKLQDSRIIVKEDGAGKLLTMAHLNPYEVSVRGRLWRLSYIVGVATAEDSRRQGHMRDIFLEMLADMHREGVPFCYLMPASASYYKPFGFAYIYEAPRWELDEEAAGELERRELRLDMEPDKLARWVNEWLAERYEVYVRRDGAYMTRIQKELDTENGRCEGWYDKEGKLRVLRAVWGVENEEQRLLYCGERYRRELYPENAHGTVAGNMLDPAVEKAARPVLPGQASDSAGIMARITNLGAMLEHITLSDDCPCEVMEVPLKVTDKLIPENNGFWRWKLNRGTSCVERVVLGGGASVKSPAAPEPVLAAGLPEDFTSAAEPPEDSNLLPVSGPAVFTSTEVLTLTIEQLTTWLFGYQALEDILLEAPPFWHVYVGCLNGVFLDEVV